MKPVPQWENSSPHALHFLHQVREEVHRLLPDAKVILHGSRVRQCNPAGLRPGYSSILIDSTVVSSPSFGKPRSLSV